MLKRLYSGRRVLAVFALWLAVAGGPPLLAAARCPPGHAFLGAAGAVDYGSYLGKIEMGRQGYWACWNAMAPEPAGSEPAPGLWWFYLALGHAARALGAGAPQAYHGALAIVGAGAVAVMHRVFARTLEPGEVLPATALALLASASGLELLPGAFQNPGYPPGERLWTAALSFPHYMVTFCGWLLGAWAWLDGRLGGRARLALAGLGGLLLSTHPFMLAPVCLAVLAHAAWWDRGRLRAGFRHCLALCAGALPGVLPVAWSLATVGWVRLWQGQVVPTEARLAPAWVQALGFGPAGLLAIAEAVLGVKERDSRRGFWAALLFSAWGLAYMGAMPRGGQQFLFFASAPAGALAAGALRRPRLRAFRPVIVALSVWVAVAVIAAWWAGSIQSARQPGYPWYVSQELVEAGKWLRERAAAGDVAAAPLEVGNLLPWLAGLKVRPYAGHPVETPGFERHFAEVQALFEGTGGVPAGVRWVVEAGGVEQVLAPRYGEKREWRLVPIEGRAGELGLVLRFENGGVRVWECVERGCTQ